MDTNNILRNKYNLLMYIVTGLNFLLHINYSKLSFTKPFSKIQLPPVTRNEIIAIVKSLKSTNSHGYDGISSKVLKTSLPFIISPLIYIHIYAIYLYGRVYFHLV